MNIFRGLIIIAFLGSCNSFTEKDKSNHIIIDSTKVTAIAESKARVEKSENSLAIDSSKLVRAFDNIYFGIPKSNSFYTSEEVHEINYKGFTMQDPTFDSDYGLYEFKLKGTKYDDFDNFQLEANSIAEIVSSKYGSKNQIREIDYDEKDMRDALNSLGKDYGEIRKRNGDKFKMPKFPLDNNYIIYINKWKKDDIEIKFGYLVNYDMIQKKDGTPVVSPSGMEYYIDENPTFEKFYYPIFKFSHVSISKDVTEQRRNRQKEKIKEESSKF